MSFIDQSVFKVKNKETQKMETFNGNIEIIAENIHALAPKRPIIMPECEDEPEENGDVKMEVEKEIVVKEDDFVEPK